MEWKTGLLQSALIFGAIIAFQIFHAGATPPCEEGWEYRMFANECYLFYDSATVASSDSCKEFCNSIGEGIAPMACVSGLGKNAYLKAKMIELGFDKVALPLRDLLHTGDFQWDDHCESDLMYWASGEPSKDGGRCAAISLAHDGKWETISCSEDIGKVCVCQTEPGYTVEFSDPPSAPPSPCPDDWVAHPTENKCYYFEGEVNGWDWCNQYCGTNNASMLCLDNSVQSDFVYNYVGDIGAYDVSIGLSDPNHDGTYTWNAGCSSTFIHWASNEPSNGGNQEHCAYIKRDTSGIGWKDDLCLQQTEGIREPVVCACEIPKNTTHAPMVAVRDPVLPPSCPEGWVYYEPDETCYFFEPSTSFHNFSSDSCYEFCFDQNLAGVCIENNAQRTFLQTQLGRANLSVDLYYGSGTPFDDYYDDAVERWQWGCDSNYERWANNTVPTTSINCAILDTEKGVIIGVDCDTQAVTCGCQAPLARTPSVIDTRYLYHNPAVFESDTYAVRNGFAFAAASSSPQTLYAWGESANGGNGSIVYRIWGSVATLAASRFAFAVLYQIEWNDEFNVPMKAWGAPASIAGWEEVSEGAHAPLGIFIVGNEAAFAGYDEDYTPFAFGNKYVGGKIPAEYASALEGYVQSITAAAGAFAAVTYGGTVYTWGSVHSGAGVTSDNTPTLRNIVLVAATRDSFAALTGLGKVITWGSTHGGGDSSAVAAQISQEVTHVVGARSVFAAFKRDGSLVVWGYDKYGGDASAVAASLSSQVEVVSHTFSAMAALKKDGTVVAWGDPKGGGDASAVQAYLTNIQKLYSNGRAFAAVNATGGVISWGSAAHGGEIPADKRAALSSGVVFIRHTDRAFAALKNDGTVVAWGHATHGGDPSPTVQALLTDVYLICTNDVAFSAIKLDGTVVAWGHEVSVPYPGVVMVEPSLGNGAVCAPGTQF